MAAAPLTILIFGASGDLTRRKLVPALYHLWQKRRLPAAFNIVGAARRPYSDEEFRQQMRSSWGTLLPDTLDEAKWAQFAEHLHYRPLDVTNADAYPEYEAYLRGLEGGQPADRLYYLSTAPRFYSPIIAHLGAHGMADDGDPWRRVVIEKPFGHDQPSARALNDDIHRTLEEHQIYRIDHYLGKETVQNIMVFRFANAIFEPVWNRNYIDHVQITAAESVDVGHRADYYDGVGVLKDMFQNHMLQLLALVAMEPPAAFDADAIRNEKVKVLRALRSINDEHIRDHLVRGQYEGYRKAEGVSPASETETYAAVKLLIDNWRWQGVPFYLRSGKAMPEKLTEIVIHFKQPPHSMFPRSNGEFDPASNYIGLCLQPDEGIHLRFEAKVPDTVADTRSVDMEFHYDGAFGKQTIPEAYERLLLDAIQGDQALFTRADSIEYAWGLIDSLLAGGRQPGGPVLQSYRQGTWGPAASDLLLDRDGRAWTESCVHD